MSRDLSVMGTAQLVWVLNEGLALASARFGGEVDPALVELLEVVRSSLGSDNSGQSGGLADNNGHGLGVGAALGDGDPDELVPLRLAAEWLGSSPRTLSRWAAAGELEVVTISPRRRYLRRREMVRVVKERGTT